MASANPTRALQGTNRGSGPAMEESENDVESLEQLLLYADEHYLAGKLPLGDHLGKHHCRHSCRCSGVKGSAQKGGFDLRFASARCLEIVCETIATPTSAHIVERVTVWSINACRTILRSSLLVVVLVTPDPVFRARRSAAVESHLSLCMPITTMQTGTTSLHHDAAGSKKTAETTSQALGVIENPLFERNGERNVSSESGATRVLREMSENQRDRRKSFIQRGLQRSKTVKEYVSKSTASFFGLDEETEHNSYQRWTERRRRLLSKRWGELKDDTQHLEELSCYPAVPQQATSSRLQPSVETDDVDGSRRTESSASHNTVMFQRHRRKDSAYKIIVDGLGLISNTIVRRCSSRNFWPTHSSHTASSYSATSVDNAFSEDKQDTGLPSQQIFPDNSQLVDDVFFEQQPANSVEAQNQNDKLLPARLYIAPTPGTPSVDAVDVARSDSQGWSHSPQIELPSSNVGMKRIWNKASFFKMT
ncbi:hypothetical protein TNCV_5125911 [Trichonephila clavipes]|nr:hypothetical protein TNCV_5125911 [Trichonephila clavipes]